MWNDDLSPIITAKESRERAIIATAAFGM